MVSTGTPAAMSPASASLVRRSDRRSSAGAAVSAAAEKVLRQSMVLACGAPPLTRKCGIGGLCCKSFKIKDL